LAAPLDRGSVARSLPNQLGASLFHTDQILLCVQDLDDGRMHSKPTIPTEIINK
jgi:hypothetical protein